MEDNIINQDKGFKPLLNTENLNASDLKSYLVLVFGSLKVAGQKAGYSDNVRIVQILSGYKLPKNPEIIKRIADAWNINPIVLTQLFERLRDKKTQVESLGTTEVRSSVEPSPA